MLGEIWYIFRRYGDQIAKKKRSDYDGCYLQLNQDGSGHLAGNIRVTTPSGSIWCPQLSKVILSWDTLDEAIKLLRKESIEILESGGKKWT